MDTKKALKRVPFYVFCLVFKMLLVVPIAERATAVVLAVEVKLFA